jgi:aerobic carbon-monoxide dehydrogenase medium subunit
MQQFEYAAPSSIEQAVNLLANRSSAVVLAGGQRVVPELRLGTRRPPSLLVDLRRLPELRGIEIADGDGRGGLRLGALVTLDAVSRSDDVAGGWRALAEAAAAVGDRQVRNRSTVGGGLVDPRPGADLPAALVALDAVIEVAGPGRTRLIAVEEALAGLEPGAIVTAVRLPAGGQSAGSAYVKLQNPASCYAICGVAASVRAAENGRLAWCRVAVTGATSGLARLGELETSLPGAAPSAERISSQMQAAAGRLDCISDLAASGEYRRHLVAVLGERALRTALDRAGQLTRKDEEHGNHR